MKRDIKSNLKASLSQWIGRRMMQYKEHRIWAAIHDEMILYLEDEMREFDEEMTDKYIEFWKEKNERHRNHYKHW